MNSLYCAFLELYYWFRGPAGNNINPGSVFEDLGLHSEYTWGLKRNMLISCHPRPEVGGTFVDFNHLRIAVGKCTCSPSAFESSDIKGR